MVSQKLFRVVVMFALLGTLIVSPTANVFNLMTNVKEFKGAMDQVKELRENRSTAETSLNQAYSEYLSFRNSELDHTDPVAITKAFKGLDGATVASVNALSLTPSISVIGSYDENANQWCEGLEITLRTDSIENTLLRIEKMQLSIISITVQAPKSITVQISVKGV